MPPGEMLAKARAPLCAEADVVASQRDPAFVQMVECVSTCPALFTLQALAHAVQWRHAASPLLHDASEDLLPFGSTLAQGALGDRLMLVAKRIRGFNLAELARPYLLGGTNDLAKEKGQS